MPTDPDLKAFVAFVQTLPKLTASLLLQQMENDFVVEPVLQTSRELFAKLDVDGNGTIDLISEGTALQGFQGKTFLSGMDFDNNGVVSKKEWMAEIRRKIRESPGRTHVVLRAAMMHLEQKGEKA